ncbi:MAG TPA: MBL fold metallo-hydrolase, partial [Thermomicrobiales bacterium]|nr:MBL fold metallo-hydrolase [Thermomicrobiales bacterium]
SDCSLALEPDAVKWPVYTGCRSPRGVRPGGTVPPDAIEAANDGGIVVHSFGSGSSGNAFLIVTADGALLIDCGIQSRALQSHLRALRRPLAALDAVLISHEHVDHVRALPAIARSRTRIVATAGTARACGIAPGAGGVRPGRIETIGAFAVTPVGVSHDAAEPCGYHIAHAAGRVLIVTDLGVGDPALHDPLRDADLIVLEANHDEAMLRAGPYPARLKRRVLSPVGHLSNRACGDLLAAALAGGPRPAMIWLAHLSATNNRPELAARTVRERLAAADVEVDLLPLPRSSGAVGSAAGRPAARQMPLGLT